MGNWNTDLNIPLNFLRPSSLPFTPNDLPNLVLWMDAADTGTILDTGGAVDQWISKASVTNKATETGSLRPTTGTRTINGLNVLDFDGFDDRLVLDNQPIVGTQARTVIVVGLGDSAVSANIFFALSHTSVMSGDLYRMAAQIRLSIGGAFKEFANDAIDDGINPGILIFTNEANSDLASDVSNFQAYKNGGLITSTSDNSPATTIDTKSVSDAVIGNEGTGISTGPDRLDGVIAEIIVYDRVLSTLERQQIDSYLSPKWDIPLPPDSVSGLDLWLDADDVSTIADTAGAVDQWDDKSGNGNDVTQTGTNRPTTGISTINGKNAIDLDGINDYLIGGAGLVSIPLASHTIIFAVHFDTTDELQCLFGWNENVGNSNRQLFCFSSVANNFISAGQIGDLTLISEDLSNLDLIITISVDHGNTIVTRLNGVQKSSLSISAVTDTDTFLIGAEFDPAPTPGNFWNGKIGEIAIYNRLLTAAEIQQTESYFSSKWDIALQEFTPVDLGAALWLDATDASTITITGSGVSIWGDKSGNSNDLTQAIDSKRPTHNVGSNVSFDKTSNQNLALSSFAGGTLTQPTTWAITVRHRAVASSEYLYDDALGSSRQGFLTNGSNFAIFSPVAQDLASDDATLHTYLIEYNGASSLGFQDGGSNLVGGSAGSSGADGIRIGSRFNEASGGNYDIYELVIIEGALSTVDKNLLGNFMAAKHGTTWIDIT